MAIDPRQFLSNPLGSIQSKRAQNVVKRSQDFLRASNSILDAPNTIKNQVNATLNRTIKRIPQRLSQAANNIAINSVTSIAFSAFDRFQAGEGLQGIISGSVSDGFGAGVQGIFGAADQIVGTIGSDLGGGIGGIVNNIGGGILTGVGNEVISNLQNLTASGLVDSLGSAGTNIAGLFGGSEFSVDGITTGISDFFSESYDSVVSFFTGDPVIPDVLTELPFINEQSRKNVYDLIGVPQSKIANCPPEFQEMWNNIADSIAFDIANPNTPVPAGDVTAFSANVKENIEDCALIGGVPDYSKFPKHYASTLVPNHQPKFKFMFMVEFIFHPEYQHLLNIKAREKSSFEFVIKNSTRPNVSFEYDEVNMYNYWTRVPKRTLYEPMTMKFYDDDANSSNSFYTNYMRAMSPIANKGGGNNPIYPQQYQESSMRAQRATRVNGVNTKAGGASLGHLNNDATNILSEIRLYHLYDWGRLLNIYHMFNPKITNLNLDDVDMAESGMGNELEIQFAYDGLYVEPSRKTTPELMAKITGTRVGAGYGINPVYENDENDAEGEDLIDNDVFLTDLHNGITSQLDAERAAGSSFSSDVLTPSFQSGSPSTAFDVSLIDRPPPPF